MKLQTISSLLSTSQPTNLIKGCRQLSLLRNSAPKNTSFRLSGQSLVKTWLTFHCYWTYFFHVLHCVEGQVEGRGSSVLTENAKDIMDWVETLRRSTKRQEYSVYWWTESLNGSLLPWGMSREDIGHENLVVTGRPEGKRTRGRQRYLD